MDRLRYTASARLGLWDTLPTGREEFLQKLKKFLQNNAHGVLEADSIEFVPTDNPVLASITAICDKIIARGNPTLIDLDFEQAFVYQHVCDYFKLEEMLDGPNVGFQFLNIDFDGTMADLIHAAEELLYLPYRDDTSVPFLQALSPELRELTSPEEDKFLQQFISVFGAPFQYHIHRQVLLRDLVNNVDDNLSQARVDFVFQIGNVHGIFEIDGSQHLEAGQKAKDAERDTLLRLGGWKVFRIPTQEIGPGLETRLRELKEQIEDKIWGSSSSRFDSICAAIGKSPLHAAAFYSILLPHTIQRCLRGLLHLYSYEVLNSNLRQRLLIIEEDLPVVVEAFRMLYALWTKIHCIAPETPSVPEIQLDVIGSDALPGFPSVDGIDVRYIDAPDGKYDAILSHSFLLDSGTIGTIEEKCFENNPASLVRIRHALGFRSERTLQWCEPLRYNLADVERSITSNENGQNPMPSDKYEALHFLLGLVFRKRTFWDGQLRVISRLLQGKPSIVLLPTGGGKSLTYQLSGILLPGMTIVIDPLVSLMTDQVENLYTTGIDLVNFVSGQLSPGEKDAVLHEMESGRLAFTFISPERLQIQEFRNQLRSVVARFPVSLAVIDEAHCVSEWGHDFRPSYLHMPRNLQRYCSDGDGRVPTLVGLTGTASFAVLTDIQMEMQITDEEAIVLPLSFDRQELRFDVKNTPMAAKPAELRNLKMDLPRRLRTNPQHFYDLRGDRTNSGIVFCPHVNGSLGITSVARILGNNNFFAGQKPKEFKGDFTNWNNYKYRVQHAFKKNLIQELVATKSFGMGIDKPNIRYTIHYCVPQSVEAFYQEAGRAGRNGMPEYALCTILYSDDNWDSALEILYEPDHEHALTMLNAINWNDRGDILVQLWLMFNSYRGRAAETNSTLMFWQHNLADSVAGMPVGAINTKIVQFNGSDREKKERAIFRLMLLGVVYDYTINWQLNQFSVQVQRITPELVKQHLRQYLMQYKFKDFADNAVSAIPDDNIENALVTAIGILIDFIYDEIVTKRKQALRTMGELCRSFNSDQNFRESILAYLQESEFSDELRKWVNLEFDAIGFEAIHDLLRRVTTLEEIKRLVGTTRRMLDEDPQNVALRYLSMCARAQSAVESDSSVVQEATSLLVQIDRLRHNISDPEGVVISTLNEVAVRRPTLLEKIGDIAFRRIGTDSFARRLLCSQLANSEMLYSHSVKLIAAGVLKELSSCTFYRKIRREELNA